MGSARRAVTDLAATVIGENVPLANLLPGMREARARTDARIVKVGKATVNGIVASGITVTVY